MIDQLEYDTGQLDYLGQMWTWVSGEAEVVVVTLPWFKPITIEATTGRYEAHATTGRYELGGE